MFYPDGSARILKIECVPLISGYEVEGYGCTLELDRNDGSLLSYAGSWELPASRSIPSDPISLAGALRSAERRIGAKKALRAPKTPKLALVVTRQRGLVLTWVLKYPGMKFLVDAASGEVMKFEIYKTKGKPWPSPSG